MILVQIWKSQKSGFFCTNWTNYQLYGIDLLFLTFIYFLNLVALGLGWQKLTGSVSVLLRLSCSAACGILLPHPGIEPMSPALQGRFLTTGPQEKSFLLFPDSDLKIYTPYPFLQIRNILRIYSFIPFFLINSEHTYCVHSKSLSHVLLSATLSTVAARLLCSWYSPGKNTWVCCHTLLQGILSTQGSKPALLHLLSWQWVFFFYH